MTSNCEACKDLRQVAAIGNRRQMQKVHRVAMANIADGTIVEIEFPFYNKPEKFAALIGVDRLEESPREDFSTLMQSDTWPDIIRHHFRCTSCQLMFQFVVNTYHGSGGAWEPIYDEDLL